LIPPVRQPYYYSVPSPEIDFIKFQLESADTHKARYVGTYVDQKYSFKTILLKIFLKNLKKRSSNNPKYLEIFRRIFLFFYTKQAVQCVHTMDLYMRICIRDRSNYVICR
jgi:hypothetical protein